MLRLLLLVCLLVSQPVYSLSFDWNRVEELMNNIENENSYMKQQLENSNQTIENLNLQLIQREQLIVQLENLYRNNLTQLKNLENSYNKSKRITKLWKYSSIAMGVIATTAIVAYKLK